MWLSAVSNSFLYSSGQPRSLFPLGPVRPLGNVTLALYGPAEPGGGLALGRSPTLKWKGEQIAIKRPLPPTLPLLATPSHAHLFLLRLWVCLPAHFPRDQTPMLLSSSSPSVNGGSTQSEILISPGGCLTSSGSTCHPPSAVSCAFTTPALSQVVPLVASRLEGLGSDSNLAPFYVDFSQDLPCSLIGNSKTI